MSKAFDKKISEAQQHGHKYKCYHCADGDENEYPEVVANSMQMKCNNCKKELGVVEEKNKLSESDQEKCRVAINSALE